MLKRLLKTKIIFVITLLSIILCSTYVFAGINSNVVTTSYKDVKDVSYIYTGDISVINITYKEIYTDKAYIKGGITNNGKNDASYVIKVTYYTEFNEIIASGTTTGFIENEEYVDFYIMTPVSNFNYGYSLKDIAKYKVSIEPTYQGEIFGQETNDNNKTTENTNININFSSYDFVIDNYKIDMVVNENNRYDITEVLDVTFNESKHGIYREIPLSNDVIRTNGITTTNKAQITNIYVSDKYTTLRTSGNLQIKIGDANKYVYGKKQYVIKYTYNIGKDPLEDIDELYYNLIGTEWEAPIKKVEFTISMPKDFDNTKIGFSRGTYGSTDNKYVTYTVENNKITGTYNNVLMPGEALTIRTELDEGYFVNAKLETSPWVFISSAASILAALVAFVLWNKHGKDDQVVETVEFYPPDNMGPLDIAFIHKGFIDSNEVVSLLLVLANKGYISIEENKSTSIFSSGDFVIRKLKEYDGANSAEKLFMNGMFEKRMRLNSLRSIVKAAKSGDEVEVVRETNGQTVTAADLRYSFSDTVDAITSMINTKVNKGKVFETVASGLGKWLIMMIIAVYAVITIPPVVMYSEIGLAALPFALLFPLIGEAIFISMVFTPGEKVVYVNGVPTTSKFVSFFFGAMFGVLFGGMPWCMIVLPCLLVETSWLIAYAIGLASIILLLIFNKIMPKRTKYGTEMLGRILGFKRFLENAEKMELESMVAKNPEYFYDILPYAYVLGISDKWIKQFETITVRPPNWYVGYGTFSMHTFGNFMNTTMKSAATAMTTSAPSSSSGGGGSSGGGSSGGGSGGGGGGSW